MYCYGLIKKKSDLFSFMVERTGFSSWRNAWDFLIQSSSLFTFWAKDKRRDKHKTATVRPPQIKFDSIFRHSVPFRKRPHRASSVGLRLLFHVPISEKSVENLCRPHPLEGKLFNTQKLSWETDYQQGGLASSETHVAEDRWQVQPFMK